MPSCDKAAAALPAAGTFSIISQSMRLNCFPRCRIVHTSARVRGQIYIPEVNWCGRPIPLSTSAPHNSWCTCREGASKGVAVAMDGLAGRLHQSRAARPGKLPARHAGCCWAWGWRSSWASR